MDKFILFLFAALSLTVFQLLGVAKLESTSLSGEVEKRVVMKIPEENGLKNAPLFSVSVQSRALGNYEHEKLQNQLLKHHVEKRSYSSSALSSNNSNNNIGVNELTQIELDERLAMQAVKSLKRERYGFIRWKDDGQAKAKQLGQMLARQKLEQFEQQQQQKICGDGSGESSKTENNENNGNNKSAGKKGKHRCY